LLHVEWIAHVSSLWYNNIKRAKLPPDFEISSLKVLLTPRTIKTAVTSTPDAVSACHYSRHKLANCLYLRLSAWLHRSRVIIWEVGRNVRQRSVDLILKVIKNVLWISVKSNTLTG